MFFLHCYMSITCVQRRGISVTAPLCLSIDCVPCLLHEEPVLCLMYGRHAINAILITFDLFEFYIYIIICFDMPFAN